MGDYVKKLIIGVILIFFTIIFTTYNELILPKQYNTNIHEITNSGSNAQNIKVYLDATFIAGTIKNNDNNSFYVVFGDGVQYIVHMSDKKAYRINKYLLDNPDKSYRIIGVTKEIPNDLEVSGIKFIKKWLDQNHNHENEEHAHDINEDEFYQYFGYVYLDDITDNKLVTIIIYIVGITGLLLVLSYINKKYHIL